MAQRDTAPYQAQDTLEVASLIRNLESHSVKSPDGKKTFSCKKSSFPLPGHETEKIDSWKFMDWDYKRDDLPTYARGLFTYNPAQGAPEVVVRGYDKFFNTDEVNQTKWRNIEDNTRGPYELGVKENGCIIFLSGLPGNVLLVCSKHSTGARPDADLSHAIAGERWVERHLATKGRTKADLARELRRMNATAVAELCDDDFEEHVLAYSKDRAGLYLHGLNLNLPRFATYPGHQVQEFADEWGFLKTHFLVKEDISSVRTFLEGVAESGAWDGKDVEGFVVRCQTRDEKKDGFVDWFFKYKFEEPYLMYRQWRECTKAIIAGRPPKYRKHKKITEEYLQYAKQQFVKQPSLGKEYVHNHGIIALREGFLQQKGLNGSDLIRQEEEDEAEATLENVKEDVVLVPIATIGCGKTTVALALQKLFGWGHIQNDNIQVKVRKPLRFATEVAGQLTSHPVVFADRNNHQKRERKQLIEDVHHAAPGSHLVALHYVHDRHGEIRSVLRERVLSRGDNHQTIQAATKGSAEVIGIMDGFLGRFQPADADEAPDDAFETIIDLDPIASSRENLEIVINRLRAVYPALIETVPSSEALDMAIEAALQDYQPDIKHNLNFSRNNKSDKSIRASQPSTPSTAAPSSTRVPKKLEYFAIKLPTPGVRSALDHLFASQEADVSAFFRQLSASQRIQSAFHVTLIHRKDSVAHGDAWQRLEDRHVRAVNAAATSGLATAAWQPPVLGTCRVQLERAVWDDRVLCIVARILDGDEQGFETVNDVAHVTVGTANASIKPVESNALLQRWLFEGSGFDTGIREAVLESPVELKGEVSGVLGR